MDMNNRTCNDASQTRYRRDSGGKGQKAVRRRRAMRGTHHDEGKTAVLCVSHRTGKNGEVGSKEQGSRTEEKTPDVCGVRAHAQTTSDARVGNALTSHERAADLGLAHAADLPCTVLHVVDHALPRRGACVQNRVLPKVAAEKLLVQGLCHLL